MQLPSISLPFHRLPVKTDPPRPIAPIPFRAAPIDLDTDHRAERETETVRYMRSKGIFDTFLHFGITPARRG